jgi:hypothetical protein
VSALQVPLRTPCAAQFSMTRRDAARPVTARARARTRTMLEERGRAHRDATHHHIDGPMRVSPSSVEPVQVCLHQLVNPSSSGSRIARSSLKSRALGRAPRDTTYSSGNPQTPLAVMRQRARCALIGGWVSCAVSDPLLKVGALLTVHDGPIRLTGDISIGSRISDSASGSASATRSSTIEFQREPGSHSGGIRTRLTTTHRPYPPRSYPARATSWPSLVGRR